MDETIVRARRILEAYAKGTLLKTACDQEGLPWVIFYRAVANSPELRALKEEAREAHGHSLAPALYEAVDAPDPKRARNKIAVLTWLMERSAPNEFGQRTTVTHEGTINLLGHRIDAAAAVLDAPSEYLTQEQRAQAIDVDAAPALASPDRLSGAQPVKPNAVDIFED